MLSEKWEKTRGGWYRGRRLEFVELEIVDALPQRWTTVVQQAFYRASFVHAPSRQPCTCHTFCPPQLILVPFSLFLLGSTAVNSPVCLCLSCGPALPGGNIIQAIDVTLHFLEVMLKR